MPKLYRYPRGFLTIADASGLGDRNATPEFIDVQANPDVEMLYKFYIQRTVDISGWKFQREVIRTCVNLFGNFHQWLALQAVYNDAVYDLNFEFLKDTLLFIREGQRDMSTFTWYDIMLDFPQQRSGVAGPRRMDDFNLSDPKEFENVIGKWCSHTNGFEDMLCTAHALYGVSKKPMGAPKSKSDLQIIGVRQ